MIHCYKQNGYNIVLDVNTSGIHIVDDMSFDILNIIEPPLDDKCFNEMVKKLDDKYSKSDLEECFEEIKGLYNEGILFSKDDYKQYAEMSVESPVKSMCLNIAHDCNLRCKYCFASTGDFGKGRKLMSVETGKKAIDFLLEHSANRKNLEIDFFGGEPLMNFDTVKEIVAYARGKEKEYGKTFRFTITTNGMLLDDNKIDYINKEMSNVVLSLDGRKEINDAMRIRVDGTGCYDKIMPQFKKLVSQRSNDKDYYIRGTYTKYNLDFSEDVMNIYENGFDQVSVEPVMSSQDNDYAITDADIDTICKEYDKLIEKLLKIKADGGFCNFFHFMIDLNNGPCAIKRLKGCGCGNEYIAITPDADIYPCHQFVGIEEYKMGNLDENTFNHDMKKMFSKAHIYHKDDCKNCWAKFFCSGGCNANNFLYEGDILTTHKLSCKLQKKRFECAILMGMLKELEKDKN